MKHLGQSITYSSHYNPAVLDPIRRRSSIDPMLNTFLGEDLWHCYELTWLNGLGQSRAGLLSMTYDARSQFMIESKSFKLYLQSLHMMSFPQANSLASLIRSDIQAVLQCSVEVNVVDLTSSRQDMTLWRSTSLPDHVAQSVRLSKIRLLSLDQLSFPCDEYHPNSALLRWSEGDASNICQGPTLMYTDGFRSLCPVTGQPDLASILVLVETVEGELNVSSVGQYLTSYRLHQGFHEACIESIFLDLIKSIPLRQCAVIGRFTRRGGIDINPARYLNSESKALCEGLQIRLWRQ